MRSRLGISPRDRSEIKEILHQARSEGVFDIDEAAMLDGVLEVSETQVREVMVPRSQMVVIERGASASELLPLIIDSGHSRFPVIGEDRDEVVGILLAKDLLRYFSSAADSEFDMREYMRTPVFIPESKRLRTLLKEFRASHNHMAIVVDEYGAVAGLLTIEDVLEQIVGDIDDEHDIEDQIEIRKDSDRCFFVSAQTRIDDFNEYFGSEFSDEEYGTVGGLVLHEMGRLPGRGESVSVERFHFKVTRAGRRRIDTLEVTVEHGVIPGTAVDA
ncbi:MAG: HlyC/CorC family transporter [Gammaproteobacteria bacterium]